MSVKITAFEAENVKRIKAVAMTPAADGLTVIGGDNGQGKTSVLDAIAWALGGNKYRPEAAQRDGSVNPPHLKVTLSNGLIVERKGKNSDLTVTDPAGRRGGQQLLDAFVSQLALDLPRFMGSSDKEKADVLLKIIGVGDKLAEADKTIKALYDQRTAVGQIADQKAKFAAEMPEYPDAPPEAISAADLIRRQQEILSRNGENQRLRDRKDAIEARLKVLTDSVKDAQNRLQALLEQQSEAMQEAAAAQDAVLALVDEPTDEIEHALQDIEAINAKVMANARKAQATEDAKQYGARYEELTAQLAEERRARVALLDGADLPLPGLGVADGRLTYNGRHWSDMSGSEQLQVSTAIVRRLNPECGFVLLDKLEQMDGKTLASFGAWLEAEGLQAIATRVSTGGECQIIIEDGRIVGADAPAETAQKWKAGEF